MERQSERERERERECESQIQGYKELGLGIGFIQGELDLKNESEEGRKAGRKAGIVKADFVSGTMCIT